MQRRRSIRFSTRRLEPLEPRLLLIGPGDDVGDTRAAALPLAFTYGQTGNFADEIGQPGDVDLFRLDLHAGDRVDLKLESTSTGEFPFFGLLRVFGVATGIDQPADDQLSFVATQDGTFHAGVSGFGNDQYDPDVFQEQGPPFTGSYRLEYAVTAAAPLTSDDTLAGAKSMGLAVGATETVSGRVEPAKDVDVVAVELAAGNVLRVRLPSGNAVARVFDAQGRELVNDPCAVALPGEIVVSAPQSSLYYVGVSGAGNTNYDPRIAESGDDGAVGEYQFTITRDAGTPPTDGDTLSTAFKLCFATATLPRERTVEGELASASDVDLYRVELAAGEAIEATVQAGAASILNSVLRVFDAEGRPVADNIAAVDAGGENPPLRYGTAVGGVYYVGVSAVGNAQYDPTVVNGVAGQSFGKYALLARVTANDFGNENLPPTEPPLAPPQRPVPPAETVTNGELASREEIDTLPINVTVASRFEARALAENGNPANVSLEVTDAAGNPLLTSAPGDATLAQHLTPGDYVLKVRAGDATPLPSNYRLLTRLTPATSVLSDFVAAEGVTALATSDFTGDGVIDAVVANGPESTLTFFVGLGDGTFAPQSPYVLTGAPSALAVADLNGDGRLDLAVGRRESDRVAILVGGANGWFDDVQQFAVGVGANALAAGDLNSDGVADLVAAVAGTRSLVIVSNLDQPNTLSTKTVALADPPSAVAAGDFNRDGRIDLAAALRGLDQVAILTQGVSGEFSASTINVGNEPSDLAVADFDADGDVELAAGLAGDGNVTLLRNRGDGTFGVETIIVDLDRAVATAGTAIRTVVQAADFSGDSRPDLVIGNTFTDEVAVLASTSSGFSAAQRVPVSRAIVALDAADLNGDGRLDLLAANDDAANHGLAVRLGRGNGAFQQHSRLPVGDDPHAITAVDFNSDGRLDLVTTSFAGLSIQLGGGDGAFGPALRIAADQPQAIVAGDFNRDGRPDLAATFPFSGPNSAVDHRVGVWLGLGDGTFRDAVFYTVGELPLDVATADLNADGILDLAVANGQSHSVSVLLGIGDGAFSAGATFASGSQPTAIAAADMDGDGHIDLAIANELSDNVTVWYGLGNAQFTRRSDLTAGDGPIDLDIADLDGDGRRDIVVASRGSGAVTQLFQESSGAFSSTEVALGGSPRSVAVVRHDGDAPRIAVTMEDQDQVVVLARASARQWVRDGAYATGETPIALVAGDLSQDARPDLAALNAFTHDLTLLWGTDGGGFRNQGSAGQDLTQATPVFADLNGDETLDALVVRQSGEVLLRFGRPGTPGMFDAPLAINPGRPASAVELLTTATGTAIATLDRDSARVSIYQRNANGALALVDEIALAASPLRIAAGDVNGDGLGDLAVALTDGTVAMFTANANGDWQTSSINTTFLSPAELALFDADGNGAADLILADGAAGTIQLLRNAGDGSFLSPLVYRTGRGPYEAVRFTPSTLSQLRALADVSDHATQSLEGTSSFTFGDFDGDALPDLLVLNGGSNTFSLLSGQAADGFHAPSVFNTGNRPSDVVLGDFNRDGQTDLAILLSGEDRIGIYLGDGRGDFTPGENYSAGNLPRGLAAIDVDRDGLVDLVIGNAFGDLMTFRGFGDGTFGYFVRADQEMPLAVADLDGDGIPEVVVANSGFDRVSVQRPVDARQADGALTTDEIFAEQRDAGLLAPGAVEMVDLDADGLADMLVANRGGNELLVYRGLGDGTFASARSFYAGTNPAGITIHDVNTDGRLDVVIANAGSNDVSVLLGDANDLLRPGPRLAAGASPTATEAGDFNADGLADLLVANSGSDAVTLLFGVGGGFFDDTSAIQFPTGADPRSLLVGQFDRRPGADLVTVNARGGSLTFYSNFLSGPLGGVTISTGGLRPTAAVARDFNDDGRLDLVVANNVSGSLSVLLGFDAGLTLAAVVSELGFDHPSSMELVDFGGETGLRLLVTHEADEQPHVFTPKDFLPASATEPTGPLSPGSGLLLTLFQAGVRVLATSILIAPRLPASVDAFLATFVEAHANTPEAQAAVGALKGAADAFDRLVLGTTAVVTGLVDAIDRAVAAASTALKLEPSSIELPKRLASAASGDTKALGEALELVAAALARRLDPVAADAVLAEPQEPLLAAPPTVAGANDEPATLPVDPAREIQPLPTTRSPEVTPANLEEPLPLPPTVLDAQPMAASASPVAWTWKLWAAVLAVSASALGAGGYAFHRRRRLHIEQLDDVMSHP